MELSQKQAFARGLKNNQLLSELLDDIKMTTYKTWAHEKNPDARNVLWCVHKSVTEIEARIDNELTEILRVK
jgi:hypothetical protein